MTTEGSDPSGLDAAISLLATTDRLLVCCDFDGTISTIAEEPSGARPVDGSVAVLDALAHLPDTWSAIVSGRALIDLTQLAGMPEHVHLVGSHGTEFEAGRILAVSPGEGEFIDRIVEQCRAIVDGVDGVVLETKPASVAVHVRKAHRHDAARILDEVRQGPGGLPGVYVLEGKEVIELAVFSGTKADGVDALRERWGITGTLFAGDDATDETAFAALRAGDLGVKVGPGPSVAGWRVDDPVAVVGLLERLRSLRQAR